MEGSFDSFLSALLAYESGWDRERYGTGEIADWQLDQWAGGSVETFFPEYTSWGDLTDIEWETMAYRSMNTFGFVGYQFGEALLIDLGYYDDDFYYGNGAATNTWDGTWTGKNGVDSLEEFMTKEAQDVTIQEAFGFNLQTIEKGLAAAGKSLDDYIGTTINGVEVTLTGVLASAHLRGAPAVVDLMLYGTLSNDEFGTSILQYMEQFGGFEAPTVAEMIDYFQDRLTGDEGLGTPGNPVPGSDGGTAGVTAETADVVVDWAWGTNDVVANFDPAADTIYVGWFDSSHIDITESGGNVVFSVPSNNQTLTLQGVSLAELSAANFTIKDAGAAQEILAVLGGDGSGSGDGSGNGAGDGAGDGSGDGSGDGTGDGGTDDGGNGNGGSDGGTDVVGNGTAGVTAATATVAIDWAWGTNNVVTDFDPAADTIYVGWFNAGQIEAYESDGDVVFSISSNNQTTTLQGVSLSDLSESNFTIKDASAAQEILGLTGQTGGTGGPPSDGGAGNPPSDPAVGDGTRDTVQITWNWGVTEIVSDFAPSEDVLDFGSLSAKDVALSEADGNLHIEVVGNGGHTYVIENVLAEDLTLKNLSAPGWNDAVLEDPVGVIGQLTSLGNDEIA